MTADDAKSRYRHHIVSELGFEIESAPPGFHGSAAVVPEMFVPETACLRTSILATWADMVAGYVALDAFLPRVPVTLDLDLNLYREPTGIAVVHAHSRRIKAGKSVLAASVEFTDESGNDIAFGTASFMTAPDPALTMPPEHLEYRVAKRRPGRLRVPFAERAGCFRREPGVALLSRSEDGLNSSNTVNGGLIALAIEEAVLSVEPGSTLSSLAMRYLRPVRLGPAIAKAQVGAGLGRVEVRDAGSADRLAVFAVARTWPQAVTAKAKGAAA